MEEIENVVVEKSNPPLKLDYSITEPHKRNELVHQIINSLPPEKLTPYYLEQLTRYLVIDKETKKSKTVLTENRLFTVNKRETSFEGLISKLENGEDGIYNFMAQGDKSSIILVPKIEITEKDLQTVPGLKELREQIKNIEAQQKKATGKNKYLLTKQLIDMRRQQYALKYAYNPPISFTKINKTTSRIDLNENITINADGEPVSDGAVSFFNPDHISCLLRNYSKLKQQAWGQFDNDLFYLMQDLDNLADRALEQEYPLLYDLMIYKIDGLSNLQISQQLNRIYGIKYSPEYLTTLWRKKIPKIISEQAKKDWLIWHFTEEQRGQWKRCSKCHEIKLAHNYFFSKNNTSKDGFYSQCKDCRNKKYQKNKNQKKGENYGN